MKAAFENILERRLILSSHQTFKKSVKRWNVILADKDQNDQKKPCADSGQGQIFL
jgi:hypothetical protein